MVRDACAQATEGLMEERARGKEEDGKKKDERGVLCGETACRQIARERQHTDRQQGRVKEVG